MKWIYRLLFYSINFPFFVPSQIMLFLPESKSQNDNFDKFESKPSLVLNVLVFSRSDKFGGREINYFLVDKMVPVDNGELSKIAIEDRNMKLFNIISCLALFLAISACSGTDGGIPANSSEFPGTTLSQGLAKAESMAQVEQQTPSAALPIKTSIELDKNGFMLNGEYTLLRGGSLQWFKIPETEWLDRLQQFKAAGFNAIDLYVA